MKSIPKMFIFLILLSLLLGCHIMRERLYNIHFGVVDANGRPFMTNSWFVYNIKPESRFTLVEFIPRFKKLSKGWIGSSMRNKGADKEDNIYVQEPTGFDFHCGGARDMVVSAPGYAPVLYYQADYVVLFKTDEFAKIYTGLTDFTEPFAILKGDPDNRRVLLQRRDMWVWRDGKKEQILKAQVEEAFGKNNPFVKCWNDSFRTYFSIFAIDDSHLQAMANLLERGKSTFVWGGLPEHRNPEEKCTMTPEVWRRLLPYEIPEDIYKEYEERRQKFAGEDSKDEYATDCWWSWGKCMQTY